jgi:hypothetical protein
LADFSWFSRYILRWKSDEAMTASFCVLELVFVASVAT